jgi:DNA invertase Pin-like site-specific DNA recombinase
MRAVGYIRVSTDEQVNGPKAQADALAAWCARNGVELVAVHHDHGVSGGAELDKRPGLLAALDELERGDVLLVAKRDRLARSVLLSATVGRLVERTGARVVSADGAGDGDGPEAALMRTMIDAFAEYERALIRGRTRAALAAKKARGERVGQVPIGSRAEGDRLVVDEREAEAVALVRELRAAGWTIRAIADELTARGVPCRGERWHPTTVQRLVKRAA